jgi:carbohydrate-binding DOMON domain-containing protein
MLKWTGALAAAAVVGVVAGYGGDLLTRPNSTKTMTQTATQTSTQVNTATATVPTTVTATQTQTATATQTLPGQTITQTATQTQTATSTVTPPAQTVFQLVSALANQKPSRALARNDLNARPRAWSSTSRLSASVNSPCSQS